MVLYYLLYIIYSKKPIFLALEFLPRGVIGEIHFWGWFILSLFKGLFCKPALHEGEFLQQQQHGKEPGTGPGRSRAGCSQNWLLSFLYPKSLLWLLKGLNHHEPSLPFTSLRFFAPRLLLSTSSAHPSGSEWLMQDPG